jgi:hypothetical protein
MRKLSWICVFGLFLSLLCATGHAAVVTLKSGEKLNGFVVDERADRLVLRVGGSDVDVMNDDIVSIEFGEPAAQKELYAQTVQAAQAQAEKAAREIKTTASSEPRGYSSPDDSIASANAPAKHFDAMEEKRKQADYEAQLKERDRFAKDMVSFFDDLGYDTKELKSAVQQKDFWDKKR